MRIRVELSVHEKKVYKSECDWELTVYAMKVLQAYYYGYGEHTWTVVANVLVPHFIHYTKQTSLWTQMTQLLNHNFINNIMSVKYTL